MNRRQFLQASIAAAAGVALPRLGFGANTEAAHEGKALARPATADSVIFIWLPGGVSQTDTWDPKKHTPYEKGMRGNQLLGTCPLIDTAADGIKFGAGLETIASVMDQGTVLRSLTNETK